MAEILNAELQIDRLISADPTNGVLAALDTAGAAVNLVAWSPLTGDVAWSAPVGTGTNTRRHMFDRPVVSTSTAQFAGGTLTGDLLFTDALYDIGKAGATRPRDGFFSRNLVVGGTLALGTSMLNFNGFDATGVSLRWYAANHLLLVRGDNGVTADLTLGALTISSTLAQTKAGTAGYLATFMNTGGGADDNGVFIRAGSTATEYALNVVNEGDTAPLLSVRGAGQVLIGTTFVGAAVAGDVTLKNTGRLYSVFASGAAIGSLIFLDANDVVQVAGAGGGLFASLGARAAAALPAAAASQKGIVTTDATNAGRLVFYDGVTGARFYLTGTAF